MEQTQQQIIDNLELELETALENLQAAKKWAKKAGYKTQALAIEDAIEVVEGIQTSTYLGSPR